MNSENTHSSFTCDCSMYTRENLEQQSDSELEKICQEKKADYEQRVNKNKKIQEILSRKQDKIEASIRELQAKIDLLRAKNPSVNVVKGEFGDDRDALNDRIQKHHTTILNLQTNQIKVKKAIKEANLDFAKQQTNEKVIQKEIDHLITQTNEMNQETKNQTENMQLAVITSEYQSTHDLLDTLTLEIDTLHKQIHERG